MTRSPEGGSKTRDPGFRAVRMSLKALRTCPCPRSDPRNSWRSLWICDAEWTAVAINIVPHKEYCHAVANELGYRSNLKMKRASYFVAFVCLSVSFILVDNAAGGEYIVSREGFTKEFSVILKQGNQTSERKIEGVVGPKTNLNGILVDTIIVTTKKPSGESVSGKEFSLEDDRGVKSIALQGPRDTSPKIYEHDDWELKYPLATGATWTSTEKVRPLKEQLFVPFTCVIETMDDVVTVAAGTFERCMRVRKSFSGKVNLGSYGGNPEVTVERLLWYAPGVGQVKGSIVTKCGNAELGGGEGHFELISYKN